MIQSTRRLQQLNLRHRIEINGQLIGQISYTCILDIAPPNPIQFSRTFFHFRTPPPTTSLNSSFPTGPTTDSLRHNESERSILRMMHGGDEWKQMIEVYLFLFVISSSSSIIFALFRAPLLATKISTNFMPIFYRTRICADEEGLSRRSPWADDIRGLRFFFRAMNTDKRNSGIKKITSQLIQAVHILRNEKFHRRCNPNLFPRIEFRVILSTLPLSPFSKVYLTILFLWLPLSR